MGQITHAVPANGDAVDDFNQLPRDAAIQLKTPESTLAKWRCRGFGPPFQKLGKTVLYSPSRSAQWLAERVFRSTGEASVAADVGRAA